MALDRLLSWVGTHHNRSPRIDPHKVSLAYTPDSWWRNRSTFVTGRSEIVELLTEKWTRELDYRLIDHGPRIQSSSQFVVFRAKAGEDV